MMENTSNIPGFAYLRTATYTCGGQTHTVKEYLHKKTGMEFVLLPGGSFMMGSNDGGEKPVHQVTLSPFLISKYEVTQAVWKRIMGKTGWKWKRINETMDLKIFFVLSPIVVLGSDKYSGKKPLHRAADYLMAIFRIFSSRMEYLISFIRNNPSNFKGDNLPVERVTWNDCQDFCKEAGVSLPTEAQWEYACRTGTSTKYYWGDKMDGDYCWYNRNSGETTHPVGEKKPNAFGLYDMSGNVWEWCETVFHRYDIGPADENPWAGSRVCRGGSWGDVPECCRSAKRSSEWLSPEDGFLFLGFRVCVSLS